MAVEWFLARVGRETVGPISAQQLRQMALGGEVQPTDLVWRPGLPKWLPARQMKGLLPDAVAPPAATTAAHPEPSGARVLDWRTEEPPPAGAPPPAGDEQTIAFSSKDEAAPDEEPWYYGFLSRYARVVLWLGLFTCVVGFVGVVAAGVVELANAPVLIGSVVFVLIVWGLLALLLTGLAMLSLVFGVALVLLAVDAARQLRAIQRTLEKR